MEQKINNISNMLNDLKFVKLSKQNQDDLTNFDCLNADEIFEGFNSKKRKKFRKYSQEINNFLIQEALQEQIQSLNTTCLLYHKTKIVGFISLCNDSLRLALEEKEEYNVPYANIPSLKIARLAIDKDFQKLGVGKFLLQYAINISLKIREYVGIKFITVDCYEHRISYYENIGFVINKNQKENRQPDSPLSLRLNIDKYLENM